MAAEDSVVVAAAHPFHELLHAPHGIGMRSAPLGEHAQDPVPARVPLLVLGRLAEEGVEVEAARRHACGHHHEHAAGDERIAAGERARPVGGQLRRAGPLEQHRQDRAIGKPDQEREHALQLEQDRERGRVEDVIGQDVSELVPEEGPGLVGVEHLDELRRDDDDRPPGADRHRIGAKGEVGRVEVGQLRQIERLAGPLVDRPQFGQLLRPDLDRVRQEHLPQRPLVLELAQLPHDLVDARDLCQRLGRRAVGRMLERPRRDPFEPVESRLLHGKRLSRTATAA